MYTRHVNAANYSDDFVPSLLSMIDSIISFRRASNLQRRSRLMRKSFTSRSSNNVLKVSSLPPSKSILACQRTTPIDANEYKKRAIKNSLVNWGMFHGYPRPNYLSSCLCKWLKNKFSNRYRSKRRFSTSAIKFVAVFFSLAQKNCFWRFKLKVSRRAWLRVAEKKQKEQLESRIWLAAN